MSWDSTIVEDPGWDRALVRNHDAILPPRNKTLQEKIISQRLVCSYQGNIYVFNPLFNSWFVIMDIQTILFLNNLMDLSMASVNYEKAFEGYVRYIESRGMDYNTLPVPLSVCIGSRRLSIEYSEQGLTFTQCPRIVPSLPMGEKYDIVGSLSIMSLDMRMFPTEWQPTYRYPLYRYVAQLFADNPEGLETVKWIIGKALLDPTSFSKVLCLWGEGEKGKSKILQAIIVSLKGCATAIPERLITLMSNGIPANITSMVVSNRVLTAGDVDTHYTKTNLAFMKSITGQDYVSIPPTSVRSRCFLVYSTNTLDSPRDDPEWTEVSISRRFNVVHMKTSVPGGIADEVPQDIGSRIDFVCHCIYTAVMNPDMPMSIEDLLLSMLGSSLLSAISYLSYVSPANADDEETIVANCIIASYMGIDPSLVGDRANKRTRRHTKNINGIDYIVGIVPSKNYK